MRLRYRYLLEHAACVALLSCAPVLLLGGGALTGHLPVDTASALSFPPWEEARDGVPPAAHPEANPAAQRYVPWYTFINSCGTVRETLWNPLEYAGLPFFAAWRTRCLSPFTFPFYFLDLHTAFYIAVFCKLWVAGFLAFYAARRMGLAPPLALIPAASFQLSGPLLVWSIYPLADVLPWFPLVLLFAERVALGHYRAWVGGALAMALMLLGGEPEACVILFAATCVYFIVRVIGEWRGFPETSLSFSFFVAALALSLAVAAIQILPFIEFNRFVVRAGAVAFDSGVASRDWSAWVLPYAAQSPHAPVQHVGLVLLLLVPVWLSLRKFAEPHVRRPCEALLLVALLSVALVLVWRYIEDSIPHTTIRTEHILAGNALILGLVAGFTAHEWLQLGVYEIKSTLKRLAVLMPIAVGAAIAALVFIGEHDGLFPGPWWAVAFASAVLVCEAVALVATAVKPSVRLLAYALTLLVGADLLFTFVPAMPWTPRPLVFPETPFIAQLKKSGERVTGSAALEQWPLAGNLMPQLYGAAGVVMKHQHDYKQRAKDDPLLLRRSGSPLLLLNNDDISGTFAPIREMLRIEQVFPTGAILFYDTEANGRAWMAYEARNVERYSPEELSSTKPVLVEQGVPPPPLPPDKHPGAVIIDDTKSNTTVAIRLDGVSRGILVLADAYFPGWEARVDGQPARVFPVDVLFRGVEVPEGAKEVVFTYTPPLFKAGMAVSGVSLLAVTISALVLAPSTVDRLRKRRWG